MKFIKCSEKQWEKKKGYSKKIFLTEKDLNFKGAHVQELKLLPGEAAKIHHHKRQTEIFYFLNNNGYFIVNKEKITINPGDLIVIEPNDNHEVINNTQEDFLYIAFKLNYKEDDIFWD